MVPFRWYQQDDKSPDCLDEITHPPHRGPYFDHWVLMQFQASMRYQLYLWRCRNFTYQLLFEKVSISSTHHEADFHVLGKSKNDVYRKYHHIANIHTCCQQLTALLCQRWKHYGREKWEKYGFRRTKIDFSAEWHGICSQSTLLWRLVREKWYERALRQRTRQVRLLKHDKLLGFTEITHSKRSSV